MSAVNDVLIQGGTPGTTTGVTSAVAAAALADAFKYRGGVSTGNKAKAVLIYVEDYAVRIAWGVAPVPGTPLGYPVSAGGTIVLSNWKQIDAFQHIRETGSDAKLQVTAFF
jgi:hypothetical protein